MRKLKYVKLFENYNENLSNDLRHIIEYNSIPLHRNYGDKLYAGQNSNFQQNLTKDGEIIGESDLAKRGILYLIGKGDTLVCYNCDKWKNENKNEFLSIFNSIQKTNYKELVFSDYRGISFNFY